ncbi:MAG: RNA-binding protein [Oscillospiraceae bacterium]|nr:RNA-binding protein [Oscillospiraceae bacterium]
MENYDLIRRAEDLAERCERSGMLTRSGFLSPAERYQLENWAKRSGTKLFFCGGMPDAERTVAFFLPDWMEEDALDPQEHLRAMKIQAFFGEPSHRDYMGAILGMGIGREWLGDILVSGDTAHVFCMPSVLEHLLSIEKVGRICVKAEEVPLSAVPVPKREVEELSFSVMSMRLDAIAAGMFRLSRAEAARQIETGALSLNYEECLKTDKLVQAGDVISLRGRGKGKVTGTGGTSRKGRIFVYAEIRR